MKSYLSPKVKVRKSKIHKIGLFVDKPIRKGEIIGIKDGEIVEKKEFIRLGGMKSKFGQAMLQISNNFFIGPRKKSDIQKSMMHINHSCNPNLGLKSGIISVALRDIKKDEELCVDYATIYSVKYSMKCGCGFHDCRKIITGDDWRNPKIQKRYKGLFQEYLKEKIDTLNYEIHTIVIPAQAGIQKIG